MAGPGKPGRRPKHASGPMPAATRAREHRATLAQLAQRVVTLEDLVLSIVDQLRRLEAAPALPGALAVSLLGSPGHAQGGNGDDRA